MLPTTDELHDLHASAPEQADDPSVAPESGDLPGDNDPPPDQHAPLEAPDDPSVAPESGAEPHDAPDAVLDDEVPDEAAVEVDKKNWYIIKVQSGREDSIREAVERRVRIEALEEFFDKIIVPIERVPKIIAGKRVVRKQKMFPGYLMAHVEYNDRILYLFRETSGVGDFVGGGPNRIPIPMPDKEVERILRSQEEAKGGAKMPVGPVEVPFHKGDKVKVREGTFANQEGVVKEIIEPKDAKDTIKVRIEMTIFGRPVPVEVDVFLVENV